MSIEALALIFCFLPTARGMALWRRYRSSGMSVGQAFASAALFFSGGWFGLAVAACYADWNSLVFGRLHWPWQWMPWSLLAIFTLRECLSAMKEPDAMDAVPADLARPSTRAWRNHSFLLNDSIGQDSPNVLLIPATGFLAEEEARLVLSKQMAIPKTKRHWLLEGGLFVLVAALAFQGYRPWHDLVVAFAVMAAVGLYWLHLVDRERSAVQA